MLDPKQALPKSSLLQSDRVPDIDNSAEHFLAEGSLSELLNSSQIRACIDAQLPSPAHMAHGQQARAATKSQAQGVPEKITFRGYTCYSLAACGSKQEEGQRFVPAVVTNRFGSQQC